MTATTKSQQQPLQPRPTLIIGLGGTGHRIAVWLKSLIWRSWPAEQIADLVRILVFDTAQEDLTAGHNGRVIALEPGSELFDIGQTPVANIKRNLAQQSAIEARLGGVMAILPPTVLRNGAKQLRPLGLLAFLWRYPDIETQLRDAIWALAGRQHNNNREGVNVFIVNSLVGGTGSSAFLDVAHVVRDLFDELGTLADFCYITGVGVMPRAFHGISGPNLIPNAVASLKELNHCMLRGGFKARYPNGRTVTTVQPPFNIYYLVDGIDERGQTWNGPGEVCRLAAEAIFLQIGSQVGQKHDNDFDNLDEVLVRQTEAGDGTFYGSFGLASLSFAGQTVARTCAVRQGLRLIDQALLAAAPGEKASALDRHLDEFWTTSELDLASLNERLARDDQDLPLTVELGLPGWVNRLAQQAVAGELVRYVRDYEQARLNTDYRRHLTQNEARLALDYAERLSGYVHSLAVRTSLPGVEAWLNRLNSRLERLALQLTQRQAELESQQIGLSQELGHLEQAFLQAADSGFLGRGRRIAQAQHAYMTAAQTLFELRWQLQLSAAALKIVHHLIGLGRDHLLAGQATMTRLQAVRRSLREQAVLGGGEAEPVGVTTRSLAGETLVTALFERHAPPVAETLAALFSGLSSPLDWRDRPPAQIEANLLAACQAPFAAVAGLTVEQALTLNGGETSVEGYHAWLMGQATPSWNLDRTRLPEGGAALQRLEVLGVPDEAGSLFRRQVKTLVSTGDSARVTAFVAHLGAPHTAIQQWDSYQALYDQARGHVPLHILPEFQVDNERGRQTFALGSIFGFIKNQGAYFYYSPADPLARPLKLAQGLANSLEAFCGQERLVLEVRERVEQVVAGRGVEATLRTLERYYQDGNGRYPADDLVLGLKRLVRAYADELRQIHQFTPGSGWLDGDEQENVG
jgi:hypothetical protein